MSTRLKQPSQDEQPSTRGQSADVLFYKSSQYISDLYERYGDVRHDFRNYNLMNLITSEVEGDNVLDIGCGSGFLLNKLSETGKNAFGIEANGKLFDAASRLNPNLSIFHDFAQNIDNLISQKMDTITMIDVLEHIEDDDLQIKKVGSHLDKNGQLVIVTSAYPMLFGKRDKNLGHYRRYSKKDLADLLSNNGFKIIKLRYWNMLGFFPYLFSEKIVGKELNLKFRGQTSKGSWASTANRVLYWWFRHIENRYNFGFGLSLICVGRKK